MISSALWSIMLSLFEQWQAELVQGHGRAQSVSPVYINTVSQVCQQDAHLIIPNSEDYAKIYLI